MRIAMLIAVLALAGCGDDDGGDSGDTGDVIDASSDGEDGGDTEADASGGGGGTQGVNQFCETLPEGGPYCMDELECCEDKVCRYEGDCAGGDMFIPCDCTDECPTGLCCDVDGPMENFCTKPSACNDYDGEEDTTCP